MKKNSRPKTKVVTRVFAICLALVLFVSNIPVNASEDVVFTGVGNESVADIVQQEEDIQADDTESASTESASTEETDGSTDDGTTEGINEDMDESVDEEESSNFTYDPQPESMEEVQAAIEAWEAGEADKPCWESKVDANLMPNGWRCDYLTDEESGAVYWTFFVSITARNAAVTVADQSELQDAISNAVYTYADGEVSTQIIEVSNDIDLDSALVIGGSCNIGFVASDTVKITAVSGSRHIMMGTSTSSRLLADTDIALTFKDVVLDGDENETVGGGIAAYLAGDGDSTLELTGAVIQNCNSTGYGGGVYVDGGDLTMDGSIISNNSVSATVDSYSACGGGVYVSDGDFTMTNSIISNNSVGVVTDGYYSAYGGGVYVSGGNFAMTAGKISNNEVSVNTMNQGSSAEGYGGGVYVDYDGNFTMTGGEISNNSVSVVANSSEYYCSVTGYGGGVYVGSGDYTMTDSTISKNSVSASANSSYSYPYCSATSYGGGVYIRYGNNFTITSSKISDNGVKAATTASSGYVNGRGGGMYIENTTSDANVTNSEIIGNTVDSTQNGYGGGIYFSYAKKTVSMKESKINDNIVRVNVEEDIPWGSASGGGAYMEGEGVTMEDSEISGNEVQNDGYYETSGGGAYIYGNFMMKGDSEIINNSVKNESNASDEYSTPASVYGGGVYIQGRLALESGEVNDNMAISNNGEVCGGGVYGKITGGSSYINGASVINNKAVSSKYSAYGGGLYITSNNGPAPTLYYEDPMEEDVAATFTMRTGTIAKNIAETNGDYIDEDTAVNAYGGGIYMAAVPMIMIGGTIGGGDPEDANIARATADKADAYGGGICLGRAINSTADDYYNNSEPSSLAIEGGDISSNIAESLEGYSYGGGVYGNNSYKFYYNFYNDDGEDGYEESYSIEMSGGKITKNEADYGGGLYANRSYFGMSGGTITNNSAHIDGGGIYGRECSIEEENTEHEPSPPYYYPSYSYSYVYDYSIEISGEGKISGNIAKGNGGGMYLELSCLEMKGGEISDNTAKHNGGGIYARNCYDGEPEVDSDVGWAFSTALKRSVKMSGGEIVNNSALINGGGMYLGTDPSAESIYTMSAGKIDGNIADNGGGLYVEEDAVFKIENSLMRDTSGASITNNIASNEGGGIYTEKFVDYSNLTQDDYQNITTGSATVFRGNSASAWYTPPAIASSYSNIGYSMTSISNDSGGYLNTINNYDINYIGTQSTYYMVTYNANGGTGTAYSTTNTVGTTHTVLPNTNSNLGFSHTGYTLLGWSTNQAATTATYTGTGSETVGGSASAGDTITLYAVWRDNSTPGTGTYNVTYNANSGTGTAYSTTNTVGTLHTVLANTNSNLGFFRTGYTLLGWSTIQTATTADYTGTGSERVGHSASAGDTITLYAVWVDNATPGTGTYNVTYNANGGTGTTYSITNTVGTLHTVLSNTNSNLGFSRTGYTLLGWSTIQTATTADYTGTGSERVGHSATAGDTITLYAVWRDNSTPGTGTYNVTYNTNGGIGTAYSTTNTVGTLHTVLSNTNSNLGFSRTGYTLLGWSTNQTATTATYTGTGSETIGGSASAGDTITLYAVWRDNSTPGTGTYNVTYNANGGIGTTYSTTNTVGTLHTVLSNTNSNLGFSRTGYTFLGWSTNQTATTAAYTGTGSETVGNSAINGETITLYAVWKYNSTTGPSGGSSYTVTYTPNGGSGTAYSVSNTVGSAHTVLSNSSSNLGFARTGYTFLGWSTNQSATTAAYTGTGSETVGANAAAGATITLYAVWKADTDTNQETFTVTYDPNGGSGDVYSLTVSSGSKHTVKDCLDNVLGYTYEGYSFGGWNTATDKSGTFYAVGEKITINENITLYAQWTSDTDTSIPTDQNNNKTTESPAGITPKERKFKSFIITPRTGDASQPFAIGLIMVGLSIGIVLYVVKRKKLKFK